MPVQVQPAILPPGARWRGLVCGPAHCELRPVRLQFEKQEDGTVRVSHARAKARVPPREFTVALVAGLATPDRQPLPAWFTLRSPRLPQDGENGSLGVTIASPGAPYRVLPRWQPGTGATGVTLYLEQGERQQSLGPVPWEAIEVGVRTRDLLVWAGDLDGDGRLDLVTRTRPWSSSRAGLHLWLSSKAAAGQMLGLAASLDEWTDVDEAEGC